MSPRGAHAPIQHISPSNPPYEVFSITKHVLSSLLFAEYLFEAFFLIMSSLPLRLISFVTIASTLAIAANAMPNHNVRRDVGKALSRRLETNFIDCDDGQKKKLETDFGDAAALANIASAPTHWSLGSPTISDLRTETPLKNCGKR